MQGRFASQLKRKKGVESASASRAPRHHPAPNIFGAAAGMPTFLRQPVQPKLLVAPFSDPLEREADHVADRIMRAPSSDPAAAPCSCSATGGMCEECKAKQGMVSRKPAGQANSAPPTQTADHVLSSPGSPLDGSARAFFEPRFGRDFSDVRIHDNAKAASSARSINALAYTTGSDIVFASGQFSPETHSGRSLLAHELTHVTQQTSPHRTQVGTGVPNSHVQRKPAEDVETSAESFVHQYLQFPYMDIKGLATALDIRLAAHDYEFIWSAFDKIGSSFEDNVAAEMLDPLEVPALSLHTATSQGQKTLDKLYEALITGSVSAFERKQSEKILEARRISPKEYVAQAKEPLMVFPMREQRFLRDTYATFRAELLPSGKVWVKYTSVRAEDPMFKNEAATFAPYGGIMRPQELDPDRLVGVKLYDAGGQFATVPALQLIDFSNQLKNKTLSLAKTAFITGLTIGWGGLGGAAVEELEAAVIAQKASSVALWTARTLLWADRVATILPALTEIVNDNRDWILENVPGGQTFLNALDKANAIAAYYGWGRLGYDGLRFMKSQVVTAWAARQQARIPENLSASERQILGSIDRETENALNTLTKGEEELAADAVNYVSEHPNVIEGEAGQRHAPVGEGHEIVELPGGSCELHSPGGLRIPCPKGMGASAPPPLTPEHPKFSRRQQARHDRVADVLEEHGLDWGDLFSSRQEVGEFFAGYKNTNEALTALEDRARRAIEARGEIAERRLRGGGESAGSGMDPFSAPLTGDQIRETTPGVATGGRNLPPVSGRIFDPKYEGRVARIPGQIADQLRHMKFSSWRHFRETFWRLVSKDDGLRRFFTVGNQARIASGRAPFAETAEQIGSGVNMKVQLNHIKPLEQGGGLYDLDNIEIVTPLAHQTLGTN